MGMLESRFDLNDPEVVAAIDDVSLWSAPFGLALLDVVRLRPHIRALDIGSGLGFPAVELSQRLGPTCEVHGIDPWLAANARARRKIRTWGIENLRIHDGQAESLPFDAAYFDLVVSNNGTNNVDDEEKTFQEIGRVAKPGAQIVLTLNLPGTMQEFYDVYRRILQDAGKSEAVAKLAAHVDAKRKPLSHTRSLLERAGLVVHGEHHDSFRLRYNDGAALLQSSLIRLGFLEAWRRVLDPEERDSIFADVETALDRAARAAGELCLTVPWVCLDLRKPA